MKSLKLLFILLLITSCNNDNRYPDLSDGLYAEFVTNKDTMVAQLFFEKAPVTVANFVALAEGEHPMVSEQYKDKRYYDGITFHRVIDNFMIQGGDPTATGSGSPGYRFEDEFNEELRHNKPGILSMANAGPGTNGSQFFITEVPTPNLDAFLQDGTLKNCSGPRVSCHAVFGELVKGLNIQDSISNVPRDARNKPIEDVVILELNIIRKGFKARRFDAVKTWETELPLLEEKVKTQREEAARIAQEKAQEAAKIAKQNADAAKEIFLKNNEKEGKIKRFPSGLAMILTKEGTSIKPTATDSVLVSYAGYFEDGRLFDTNWRDIAIDNNVYAEQRETQGGYEPFTVICNETAPLVPGFREAILNMNVKDKVKVFIPSYLGYGPQGFGPIPPNTNLVFDIEIEGVVD